MTIDYKKFQDNDRYKILITGFSGGRIIESTIVNEVPIAGGNNFSTAEEIAKDAPVVGKALDVVAKGGKVLRLAGATEVFQAKTIKVWESSQIPQFNVELAFYQSSLTEKENVLDKLKIIQSSVLPGTSLGGILTGPLGYQVGTRGLGRLNLSIGRWFRATGLIMVSTNLVPSKEVNRDGIPISLTGTVTLEPDRAITYAEFSSYLRATTI